MKKILIVLLGFLLICGFVIVLLGFSRDDLAALKKRVTGNPNNAKAHYRLGFAYEKLGRWPEAMTEFKEAIRLKPDFAEAHVYLGLVYDALKDGANAILHMVEALKLFEAKARKNLR